MQEYNTFFQLCNYVGRYVWAKLAQFEDNTGVTDCGDKRMKSPMDVRRNSSSVAFWMCTSCRSGPASLIQPQEEEPCFRDDHGDHGDHARIMDIEKIEATPT